MIAVAAGLLGFLADYALNLGLSGMLEAHEFGDYRVGRAFAVFCGALVLLGGDRAAPRMLAEPLNQAQYGVAWEYLRFYGLIALTLSLLIIAVVWISGYLYHGTLDPQAHHAVSVMALTIPFMAAGALGGRTLQSVQRTFLATMPWRVGAPALFLATLVLCEIGYNGVELNQALWLACLVAALVALSQWRMVRLYALKVIERAPDAREARHWFRISVPMMGVFLVTIGLGQSDLYFLEWLGGEASVGHYAAAITTSHFIPVVQTAIVGLYAPLIAMDARTALAQGQRVMVVGLSPIMIGLLVGAEPAMGFFGKEYQDEATVLRLLALGNGAWAMAALGALWLQYAGRGLIVVRITVLALICDSLLNILLIPWFGTIGAAASTAATSIAAATATGVLVQRSGR